MNFAGLKIHNTVMREVMGMFGGYEVKTIGDAFMVAFTSTQDGVNFGLSVHELLRGASWPASLLEDVSICAEQGPLWGGLTVRIGGNSVSTLCTTTFGDCIFKNRTPPSHTLFGSELGSTLCHHTAPTVFTQFVHQKKGKRSTKRVSHS